MCMIMNHFWMRWFHGISVKWCSKQYSHSVEKYYKTISLTIDQHFFCQSNVTKELISRNFLSVIVIVLFHNVTLKVFMYTMGNNDFPIDFYVIWHKIWESSNSNDPTQYPLIFCFSLIFHNLMISVFYNHLP